MTTQTKKQGGSKSNSSYRVKDAKFDIGKGNFVRESATGAFSFEREDTKHFLKYIEKNYREGRKVSDSSAKSK